MTTKVSIPLGGTGSNVAEFRDALNVVSKTGDTMSGQLSISSGGLNVNSGVVNISNSSLIMTMPTSNGVSNAFLIFNSDNVLKTSITDRGAQNWFVQSADNTERGSIRYSTPQGFMGILFFDGTGNSRCDIRSPAGGGIIFATGATSSVPPEFVRLDANGNMGFGTTTPSANIHIVGTIIDSPIAQIAANATYAENGAGKIIFANTTSAVTVTVANSAASGFSYTIIRGNTGNVSIANSGVTRLNSAAITSMNVTQHGAVTVVYTATNQVIVFGDFV
jgi:hypothetical protein